MQFYNSKNADSKRVNLLNFWQLSVKKLLSKRQMLQCYVCYNLKFALEWKIKVKQNVFYLEFNYYRQNMLPNGITFGHTISNKKPNDNNSQLFLSSNVLQMVCMYKIWSQQTGKNIKCDHNKRLSL